MKFYYTVQGTADDTPTVGVVTADDQKLATKKLNATYGITADVKPVELEFIEQAEFEKLQAEYGEAATHKVA